MCRVTGTIHWPLRTAYASNRARPTDDSSLGRLLQVGSGFRTSEISKEALQNWMLDRASIIFKDPINNIFDLSTIKSAPSASDVLEMLDNLDALDIPEGTVERLRRYSDWETLVDDARYEWQIRYYWHEKLPYLPMAIKQIETLLLSLDPSIRHFAEISLARSYYSDDDRPNRLYQLFSNDEIVLKAMINSAVDRDMWTDEDEKTFPSFHLRTVKQVAGWIEAKPREDYERLINCMLDKLEQLTELMLQTHEVDFGITDDEPWTIRRVLAAVLAELSERLTHRAFSTKHDMSKVISLFARVANDPYSYSSRRFAIRALGNFQNYTAEVSDVFFEACKDVSDVYRETRTAVTKFKKFVPGSLEKLTTAVKNPSVTIGYHAALLLGELGLSRSEELGRNGRKIIADALIRILEDPTSERAVYDFSEGSAGKEVGPLYDVIYDTLVRVVSGPDAPQDVEGI